MSGTSRRIRCTLRGALPLAGSTELRQREMRLNIPDVGGGKLTALASIALIAMALACGTESPPMLDLEATVVARVRATVEAIPPATAGVAEKPTSTPRPSPFSHPAEQAVRGAFFHPHAQRVLQPW